MTKTTAIQAKILPLSFHKVYFTKNLCFKVLVPCSNTSDSVPVSFGFETVGTVYSVQCTVYSVQFTGYSAHYTVQSVECTLYNEHSIH